ncbi:MAG: hypothetical protein GXP10_03670 [Gammaproteobacteria bacterium]|nr:hypothetical protein [Gammaproteobacteria bacterium]
MSGKTIKNICFSLAVAIGLSGCLWSIPSTKTQPHPLIETNAAEIYADVYFMRPRTERSMGIADNALVIELDEAPFLSLVKNEYIRVPLKPGITTVTLKNRTLWGPFNKIKEMSRSRSFTFAAGKSYFITTTPVNGEFRGIFFVPTLISAARAQEIAATLRAVGPGSSELFD